MRYSKNFNHWRDFEMLTCILAMIGLVLSIADFEMRGWVDPHSVVDNVADLSFVRLIIMILSILGAISLLFRSYLHIHWKEHKTSIGYLNNFLKAQENLKAQEKAALAANDENITPQQRT